MIGKGREIPTDQDEFGGDGMDMDTSPDATTALLPGESKGMRLGLRIPKSKADYHIAKGKRPRESGGGGPVEVVKASGPTSPTPPTKKQRTGRPQPQPIKSGSAQQQAKLTLEPSAVSSTSGSITARPQARRPPHPRQSIPVEVALPFVAHRTTKTAILDVDSSGDDQALADAEVEIVEDDQSGDDSDEWKPEEHPPPSENEEDEIEAAPTEDEEAEDSTLSNMSPSPSSRCYV